MPFPLHSQRFFKGSITSALALTLAMGMAQPSQAEFQGATSSLTGSLSGINFVQNDATALQERLTAVNNDLATARETLLETPSTSSTYASLTVTVSQLTATANALEVILDELATGKTVSRYDIVQDATGAAEITLTYSDGSTTVASIPGNPAPPPPPSRGSSGFGGGSSSSSGGSGGGSGGGSNPLSNILGSIMPQVMGNLTNVAPGMLGGMLGGMPGATPGIVPTQPTVTEPQPKKPEKPTEACRPAPEDDTTKKEGEEGKTDESGGETTTDVQADPSTDPLNTELARLPVCKPAEVDTPNPQGKGVGPGRITSMEEALAAQGRFYCDPSNSNCRSNGQQCASLTKYFAPEVGRASGWRKGDMVRGNTNLAIGTPIATFNFGNSYCDTSRGGCGIPGGGVTHTAIYLGQNSRGIQVLDQYSGRSARVRTIPWNGNRISGNYYYTIRTSGTGWLHTIPLLQPVEVALNLMPPSAGLLQTAPTSLYF